MRPRWPPARRISSLPSGELWSGSPRSAIGPAFRSPLRGRSASSGWPGSGPRTWPLSVPWRATWPRSTRAGSPRWRRSGSPTARRSTRPPRRAALEATRRSRPILLLDLRVTTALEARDSWRARERSSGCLATVPSGDARTLSPPRSSARAPAEELAPSGRGALGALQRNLFRVDPTDAPGLDESVTLTGSPGIAREVRRGSRGPSGAGRGRCALRRDGRPRARAGRVRRSRGGSAPPRRDPGVLRPGARGGRTRRVARSSRSRVRGRAALRTALRRVPVSRPGPDSRAAAAERPPRPGCDDLRSRARRRARGRSRRRRARRLERRRPREGGQRCARAVALGSTPDRCRGDRRARALATPPGRARRGATPPDLAARRRRRSARVALERRRRDLSGPRGVRAPGDRSAGRAPEERPGASGSTSFSVLARADAPRSRSAARSPSPSSSRRRRSLASSSTSCASCWPRALRDLPVPRRGASRGAVFVGTPRAPGGSRSTRSSSARPRGACLPGRSSKDPLLPDALRSGLGESALATQSNARPTSASRSVSPSRAQARVVLSYPRVDVEQARPRVPSFYLLEARRAVEGPARGFAHSPPKRDPRARPLGLAAPDDPDRAIDEAGTISRCSPRSSARTTRRAPELPATCSATNPHLRARLGAAVDAGSARGRRPTVSSIRPTHAAALARHRLEARSYSPTALQNFASLPVQVLSQAVMRLAPAGAGRHRDPRSAHPRGDLPRGAVPDPGRAPRPWPPFPPCLRRSSRVLAIADACLDRVAGQDASASRRRSTASGWTRSQRLRADLRHWLRREAEPAAVDPPFRADLRRPRSRSPLRRSGERSRRGPDRRRPPPARLDRPRRARRGRTPPCDRPQDRPGAHARGRGRRRRDGPAAGPLRARRGGAPQAAGRGRPALLLHGAGGYSERVVPSTTRRAPRPPRSRRSSSWIRSARASSRRRRGADLPGGATTARSADPTRRFASSERTSPPGRSRAAPRSPLKPLADQPARERIATDLETNLVVEAAAGTGKTTELIRRMVALLASGRAQLDRMVAPDLHRRCRRRAQAPPAHRDRAPPHEPVSPRRPSAIFYTHALPHLEQAAGSGRSTLSAPTCCASGRSRRGSTRFFEVAPDEIARDLFGGAFDRWLERQLDDPAKGVRRVLRRSGDRDGGPRVCAPQGRVGPRRAPRHRRTLDPHRVRSQSRDRRPRRRDCASSAATPTAGIRRTTSSDRSRELQAFAADVDRREAVRERDHDGLEVELTRASDREAGAGAATTGTSPTLRRRSSPPGGTRCGRVSSASCAIPVPTSRPASRRSSATSSPRTRA